jgi:hypothetical protein
MRLIGLNARLHAGKDTAYDYISGFAAGGEQVAVRRAFADPLKISGMRALGFEAEKKDEVLVSIANDIKETGRITVTWEHPQHGLLSQTITGRQLWQLYGTEAHRAGDLGSSFGPDFWVDNLLPLGNAMASSAMAYEENFIDAVGAFADYAVVTDVRFPNEAQRILDLGGEVWSINADVRLGPNTDSHASEQPLPPELVTHTIYNNTTLEDFQAEVFAALKS